MEKGKVKKSWKDVSITDYKKILKIFDREYDSPLEKEMAVCALLNGISEDDMYAKTFAQSRQMVSEIQWIKEPFSFNQKWNAKKINVNGKRCKIIQSIDQLPMSAYLDFTNFWEKKNDRMGNVLACFIIPEGYQYNEGYDVLEFAQELEDTLSIVDWNNIAFFLTRNWLTGIRCGLRLGEWEMLKMKWRTKNKDQKKEIEEIIQKMRQVRKSMG